MANNGFINTITTLGFFALLFATITGKAINISSYFSEFQQGFIYGVTVAAIVFVRRKEFKKMIATILTGGKDE